MPKKTFLQKAREICDKKNAVLILDDVRAGFRFNRSGSWFDYDVNRPNRFQKQLEMDTLSAVVGVDKLKYVASEIYVIDPLCNASSMAAS